MQDFEGASLIDNTQNAQTVADSVKVVGIYFSAHWCPPCRGFTPTLATAYNEANANGKVFEVVFATSDQDENQFKNYHASMPWLALNFGDELIKTLKTKYSVSGIPKLVIFKKSNGDILSDNGRGDIAQNGAGAIAGWANQ